MKLQIPSNLLVTGRTILTLAIGGAMGSIGSYLNTYLASAVSGKPVAIDYHQMMITACVCAAAAVFNHYRKPPNQPTVQPSVPVLVPPSVSLPGSGS